jgi:hypothetical protein
MLAVSDGPDLDDVLTVLVRHEPGTLASAGRPLVADPDRRLFGLTQLDQAVPVAASLAEVQVAAPADAEAV